MNVLNHTNHRPYPIPTSPWVMTQTWNHLLFAHWPVPVSLIRELIPINLTIDTFNGYAWIGIVPFEMSLIRMRWLPPIPFTTHFPEINVRTYVIAENKPGVYFFSLDATNSLAVAAARAFFSLPYYKAQMQVTTDKEKVFYKSKRTHKNITQAQFTADYRPVSDIFHAHKATLDYWLTERYCLYTHKNSDLYRGDIHHLPWPLQKAESEISLNTMFPLLHSTITETKPLLHYAHQLKVLIWPLVKVNE
ncbi:MAG: hypothetical protein JWM44_2380 [Bacilli bacterium]|nr:hypothetical protein [Bacilli bacterium]